MGCELSWEGQFFFRRLTGPRKRENVLHRTCQSELVRRAYFACVQKKSEVALAVTGAERGLTFTAARLFFSSGAETRPYSLPEFPAENANPTGVQEKVTHNGRVCPRRRERKLRELRS